MRQHLVPKRQAVPVVIRNGVVRIAGVEAMPNFCHVGKAIRVRIR